MGRFQSTLWPYFIIPPLFLALAPGAAFAIQTTASPVEASPASDPSSPLDDIPQMEAFLDGIMAAQMPARSVPAVSLSVVRNGEIIFAKGYGFANRAEWTPVTADRTLFRPGSISKLFTWTAVMQLFEQGKLELDRNVNEYVTQFQIPDTFPEPITMEHLLTHTPGFEDGGLGYLFVREEEKIAPLADSLAAHIPMRVRPPGTYSSYSNWGTALAGLIVANISGQKFEDYIEEHILRPLEMDHSTFHEPLPPQPGARHGSRIFAGGGFIQIRKLRTDFKFRPRRSAVGHRHGHGEFHDRSSPTGTIQRTKNPF